MIIDGVTIQADCSIPEEDVLQILAEERVNYLARNKVLGRLELTVDNGEIVIHGYSKEPIVRYRRITGYCVKTTSMNQAKQAEIANRVAHVTA